ncbi:putative inactive leucine-rich repeat receptor-like protein kinase [Zea mays]|uniref:Putative inactive leucine-rich repeat receptor-like protein kinase n=1 Tax=Zea mays TaxID=4577 RepID=A0A1D6QLP3_MAIZE|nr:putative inactive leucine-rich repeat receptor-like protein kinase [Zea mays]
MSHYKFKHSRHGSLGFLPRKRSSHHRDKEYYENRGNLYLFCAKGLGLSGELATSSLCRVRGLVALSLASNGFEGQVPAGLAALSGILQVLDLEENVLSGVLHPALFDNLTSLLNWRKSRVAIVSVGVACFIVFLMILSVIGLFRLTQTCFDKRRAAMLPFRTTT